MKRIRKFIKDNPEFAIAFAINFAVVASFKAGQYNGLNQNRIAKAEKWSHEDGRHIIELTFRNGCRQDIIWKDM